MYTNVTIDVCTLPRYTIHMNHMNVPMMAQPSGMTIQAQLERKDRHLSGSAPACLAWKGACQLMVPSTNVVFTI